MSLLQSPKKVDLDLRGAYLNLDGGFDSARNRKMIFNAGMIPNIKENPRHRKATKRGRKRLCNEVIHALHMRVERTFAWEDKFKRLLLRFETVAGILRLLARASDGFYTTGPDLFLRRATHVRTG